MKINNETNIIDERIELYKNLIRDEEAKGDSASVKKIVQYARKIHTLLNTACCRTDHSHIKIMAREIEHIIDDITEIHNNPKNKASNYASGILSILGGTFSLGAPCFEIANFVPHVANVLKGAGPACSGFASGADNFGRVQTSPEEGKKFVYNNNHEKLKRDAEEIRESKRSAKTREEVAQRGDIEADRAEKEAFALVARG